MNKNSLTYSMAFFFLISFVLLGLIVINEKKVTIMRPKIEKESKNYIEEHYSDIKNDIIIHQTVYNKEKKRFETKVTSKKNKHLYFQVNYHQRKITSTYQKDYQEASTLLRYLEKKLTKQLEMKNAEITINNSWNQFSKDVKECLLKEENLLSLKIYTMKIEQKLENFTISTIINHLNQLTQTLNEKNITPKDYTITLTNQQDITQAVSIENLTLPNANLEEIITAILNNDKTIENKYNIKYKYLN